MADAQGVRTYEFRWLVFYEQNDAIYDLCYFMAKQENMVSLYDNLDVIFQCQLSSAGNL